MNEKERRAWNDNAREVQDYHRSQDQPILGWRKEKTLVRNLAVLTFVTIPFICLVGWASDE